VAHPIGIVPAGTKGVRTSGFHCDGRRLMPVPAQITRVLTLKTLLRGIISEPCQNKTAATAPRSPGGGVIRL